MKQSATYQNSLPLFFYGDPSLLKSLQLRVQFTITILSKPHIMSFLLKQVPSISINNMLEQHQPALPFIQPIVQIQIFDQISRQNYLKNKNLLKQGVFYIYYPSAIRVDEKIYKIYQKSFQNFVKEFPKNIRNNFAKYVFWEQATGQNHIKNQQYKINQLLSTMVKNIVQKKIQSLNFDISSILAIQQNPRSLRSLFIFRNKIASVFRQVKLYNACCEHLTCLFNEILLHIKKLTISVGQVKIVYKSPFLTNDISKIVLYFQTNPKQHILQILNFIFLSMFECQLQVLQHLQGMKKLKQYLEFVLSQILSSIANKQEDISRNIWIIQTIQQALKLLKNKYQPTLLNTSKQEDFALLSVSICSQYRNAVERIGVIFYNIDTYCVFPRNLQYQLQLCLRSMRDQPITQVDYPQMKTNNNSSLINKMNFLSGQAISQTVQLILNNFNTYKLIYVRTLQMMQKTLSQSPYKKVAWSMKLSVLKSTIIYFTKSDEKRMSIQRLLQQDKSLSYLTKKSVWQKFEIINKVYRLTLCKRYNVRMAVEQLLNIVLDNSVLKFRYLWSQLVTLVSDLLFSYKYEDLDLDAIDYGQVQQQQGQMRRRKTTIHCEARQIQVGTIKFIALKNKIINHYDEEEIQQDQNKSNHSVRLNIQLSNRIVSYASMLGIKQKSLQEQQEAIQVNEQSDKQKKCCPKKALQLKLLIKTCLNQQMQIDFRIIEAQDKYIQILIQHKQVLIFKIQKLYVTIDESITLVYTMPINHQKQIKQSESKQQNQKDDDNYVNICPQIKLNTVLIFVKEKNLQPIDIGRKPSLSSLSNSQYNSQNSQASNSQLLQFQVFKNIWNPFKFNFNCKSNDHILVEKIQIQCLDEIYSNIIIGQQVLTYKQLNNGFKISKSQDQLQVTVLIKGGQTQQKQESNGKYKKRAHKQSDSSILPRWINNKASSMNASHTSQTSHKSISANRVRLTFYIKHNNCYSYTSQCELNYVKRTAFKVAYKYSRSFQQFTITSLCYKDQLLIKQTTNDQAQPDQYQLTVGEELKLFQPKVSVILMAAKPIIVKLNIQQPILLKNMIKKQHLKPDKVAAIWLSLQQLKQADQLDQEFLFLNKQSQTKISYPIFMPIQITSQEQGNLQILKSDSRYYELVGKIQGNVQYTHEKCLDIYIIPTKKGNITLPQISINSRKGMWKNKIINVV